MGQALNPQTVPQAPPQDIFSREFEEPQVGLEDVDRQRQAAPVAPPQDIFEVEPAPAGVIEADVPTVPLEAPVQQGALPIAGDVGPSRAEIDVEKQNITDLFSQETGQLGQPPLPQEEVEILPAPGTSPGAEFVATALEELPGPVQQFIASLAESTQPITQFLANPAAQAGLLGSAASEVMGELREPVPEGAGFGETFGRLSRAGLRGLKQPVQDVREFTRGIAGEPSGLVEGVGGAIGGLAGDVAPMIATSVALGPGAAAGPRTLGQTLLRTGQASFSSGAGFAAPSAMRLEPREALESFGVGAAMAPFSALVRGLAGRTSSGVARNALRGIEFIGDTAILSAPSVARAGTKEERNELILTNAILIGLLRSSGALPKILNQRTGLPIPEGVRLEQRLTSLPEVQKAMAESPGSLARSVNEPAQAALRQFGERITTLAGTPGQVGPPPLTTTPPPVPGGPKPTPAPPAAPGAEIVPAPAVALPPAPIVRKGVPRAEGEPLPPRKSAAQKRVEALAKKITETSQKKERAREVEARKEVQVQRGPAKRAEQERRVVERKEGKKEAAPPTRPKDVKGKPRGPKQAVTFPSYKDFGKSMKDLSKWAAETMKHPQAKAYDEIVGRGLKGEVEASPQAVESLGFGRQALTKLTSPSFLVRKTVEAKDISGKVEESNMATGYFTHLDGMFIDSMYSLLPRTRGAIGSRKPASKKITSALREGQAIGVEKAIEKLPKELRAIAREIREWFEGKRELMKASLRMQMEAAMPKSITEPFLEIVNKGKSFEDVTANFGAKRKKQVEIAVSEYRAIDSWGINDYITFAEAGKWTASINGTTVAGVGPSPLIATQRALAQIDAGKFPKAISVTLRNEPKLNTNGQLQSFGSITRRQRINIEARLKAIAKEEGVQINTTLTRGIPTTPTKKGSGFLKERKNILAGEEDIFDILHYYAASVNKSAFVNPVIAEYQRKRDGFSKDLQLVLDSQVEAAKGVYGTGDRFVDGMIEFAQKKIVGDVTNPNKASYMPILRTIGSGRNMRYSRATGVIRGMEAQTKLGWRPVSGYVNAAHGHGHTWTIVGSKIMKEAVSFRNTAAGKKILKDNDWALGVDVATIGNELSISGRTRIFRVPKRLQPIHTFSWVERDIREIGLLANYLSARRLGMSEKAAIIDARQALRTQNFVYNVASMPEILRGPTGKTLLQFKSYMIREAEFVSTLNAEQWQRYLMMQGFVSGPSGVLHTMKGIPLLGALGVWDQLQEAGDAFDPRFMRGFPGYLGADPSTQATIQLVGGSGKVTEQFVFLSDGAAWSKHVLRPLIEGQDVGLDDVHLAVKSQVPFIRTAGAFLQSVQDPEGWLKNDINQRTTQANTTWERFLLINGIPTISRTIDRNLQSALFRDKRIKREKSERFRRRFVRIYQKKFNKFGTIEEAFDSPLSKEDEAWLLHQVENTGMQHGDPDQAARTLNGWLEDAFDSTTARAFKNLPRDLKIKWYRAIIPLLEPEEI